MSRTKEKKQTMDWDKAVARIERLLVQSQEVAARFPNAFTGFYDIGIQSLRQRFASGERTPELYKAMMEYSE